MNYCVYITIYSGRLMPPFYIGSSSIKRIESGYRGSVQSSEYKSTWLSETKNNPHLFKTTIVKFCKTRKEAYSLEEQFQRHLGIPSNPLYINRTIANSSGKFGGGFKGNHHTVQYKKKMSSLMKGRSTHWLKGKKRPNQSKIMSGSNNPMYGKKGTNNPNFGKSRPSAYIQTVNRICCISCKKETTTNHIWRHKNCSNFTP